MCVYVYVGGYFYVLLLTSNFGVHAFACTPLDQHRCLILEVKKVTDIHIYIHTDVRTHMHAYIEIHIQTYIHTYIYTYIHTDRQTDGQTSAWAPARSYARIIRTFIYAYTYTHTYMYVHTDRYTHWCLRAHTHACATACTTKNITFRSKKLDVRKVRDV